MRVDPQNKHPIEESDHITSISPPSEVQTLRERLSRFDLIQCCMRHEKIKRASDGFSPILNATIDHGYQRVTYCPSKVRLKRLGCAHTVARNELTTILAIIPKEVCNRDQVSRWKDKISQLNLAIIQVDRKKSDAELAHARKSNEICACGEYAPEAMEDLKKINTTLQSLDREHSDYVDHLSRLLNEILTALATSGSHG